jgi:hypothetical protein
MIDQCDSRLHWGREERPDGRARVRGRKHLPGMVVESMKQFLSENSFVTRVRHLGIKSQMKNPSQAGPSYDQSEKGDKESRS